MKLQSVFCRWHNLPQWKLADIIPSIARIGYGAIEIVTHGLGWPMGYHLNPDFDQRYIDKLNETLEACKILVSCISPSSDFYKPRTGKEEVVRQVNRNIDLAVKVGAPVIRIIVTGLRDIPDGISRSEFIETIADPLSKCVDYGRSRGVKLAIETHGYEWATIPENVRDILNAVQSDYLGICLHTYRLLSKNSIYAWKQSSAPSPCGHYEGGY